MTAAVVSTTGGKVAVEPLDSGVIVHFTAWDGEASQAFRVTPEQAALLGLTLTRAAAEAGELRRLKYVKKYDAKG